MLSTFNCFLIYSPLIKNFRWVKEMNVLDNIKCLQNIKNNKLFLREEGLLKERPNKPESCQLHLTENVLQNILPF